MSAGELDPTFGLNGKVLAPFGPPYPTNQIVAVATQPDGKYVAAGEVGAGPDFGLARYNADGSLDTTFGVSGFVDSRLIFPAGSGRFSAEQFPSDIAIQPDGKILEAGAIVIVDQVGGVVVNVTQDVCLARFDATGQLDASFGVGGYAIAQFLNEAFNPVIALQPDGKIVVVGVTTAQNVGSNFELALARFNADGSLDPSFGTNGITITAAPSGFSYDQPPAVALQPDGKIVIAAGTSPADDGSGEFVVARYDASGTLDTTFGQDGLTTTQFAGYAAATSVALQPDGRIIAAGFAGNDFALARYESTGILDPSFGQDGVITTQFSGRSSILNIALQPEGQILAVGSAGPDFGLARYDASGQLDTSFGQDGMVVTSFGQISSSALAVFLQPGGTFTVAGRAGDIQFALARYFISTPPSVTSLQRFGFHAQPTEFVLTFSSALDPASAQNTNNYTLTPVGPHGHAGKKIRIVAAVYNPLTNSVTLHPATRVYLFRHYKLVVNGTAPNGLASPACTLLDGKGNGLPGSDYVRTFGPLILAGPYPGSDPKRFQATRHSMSNHSHSLIGDPRPGGSASALHREPGQIAAANAGPVRLRGCCGRGARGDGSSTRRKSGVEIRCQFIILEIRCPAAHNAVGLAGESPAVGIDCLST